MQTPNFKLFQARPLAQIGALRVMLLMLGGSRRSAINSSANDLPGLFQFAFRFTGLL
jgi:hypothetical protein